MKQETITNYIRVERAKGCTDDAILTELRKSGWAESDIGLAFDALKNPTIFQPGDSRLQLGMRLAAAGCGVLAIGVALLSRESSNGDSFPAIPSVCFLLVSLLLTPAAFFFFRALYVASTSVGYRVWAALLGICMFAFVPFTIYYFGLASLMHLGTGSFHSYDISSDFEVVFMVNFLILLPLQAIVYLFAILTALIHRSILKRHSSPVPSPYIWKGFLLMFIAALIGAIGLYVVLNGSLRF